MRAGKFKVTGQNYIAVGIADDRDAALFELVWQFSRDILHLSVECPDRSREEEL